ncbi:MAG: hypothetical protein LUO98_04890 [Methanoregula sp.]|nr:hypothetical protein [Methanoregula sp.]
MTGNGNAGGTTEIGVCRSSTHTFYLDKSGNGRWGAGDVSYTFGNAGDSPLAGGWT